LRRVIAEQNLPLKRQEHRHVGPVAEGADALDDSVIADPGQPEKWWQK
jgi:hypothetical protein